MKLAKDLGFLAVVSYGGGVSGIDAYHQDTSQMAAAGFQGLRGIHQGRVFRRSRSTPNATVGSRSITTSATSRSATSWCGRPRTPRPTGPLSPRARPSSRRPARSPGSNRQDPHFRLSQALHVVEWNGHDEASVNLLHQEGGDWAFYNGGNRWTYGTYMYKAAKQFGMKFRLSWHWNAAAGDPYYALDCREDDYAWCNASPDGRLIPSVEFERLREGLDDYRRLLTLARLAAEAPGKPAARAARALVDTRLSAFHLGQREHDALFPPEDWSDFRRRIDDAIEALRR